MDQHPPAAAALSIAKVSDFGAAHPGICVQIVLRIVKLVPNNQGNVAVEVLQGIIPKAYEGQIGNPCPGAARGARMVCARRVETYTEARRSGFESQALHIRLAMTILVNRQR